MVVEKSMLHVLKLHSLSWPIGGDSSGCIEEDLGASRGRGLVEASSFSLIEKWLVRRINRSQMCWWFQSFKGNFVLAFLFYSLWLISAFIYIYIFVWVRIPPSPHNACKSHRLIKVMDWLLGAFCFFHHFIYLFWSLHRLDGNTIFSNS